MSEMEKSAFQRTHAESCLLKRKDQNGTVVICVYVDDYLLTGDRTAIDAAMVDIEFVFETRRLGPIQECIGCSFTNMPDGWRKIIQPDMIKKLDNVFGKDVENFKDIDTPLGPRITIERPGEDEEKLGKDEQTKFRSGVGMLLYLLKHSRPDLSTQSGNFRRFWTEQPIFI
jgi:hypothetical protein